MEENVKKNYISLFEAAKLCSYSEPYLRLRARQGKLKSIKLGKKWMTTAAWIDDYDLRVQAWRESSEAKRTAALSAALVSAPEVLAKVVCPSADLPAVALAKEGIEPVFWQQPQWDAGTGGNNACFQRRAISAAGTRGAEPMGQRDMLPARAISAAGRLTGQMFPMPEQKPVDDALGYGWFGALLSGAAIALLLFMVADPNGVLKIMKTGYGAAGQASVVRTILPANAVAQTSAVSVAAPVFEDGVLEEVVRRMERFFSDF